MSTVQIIVTGESAVDAAKQYRDFMTAMQFGTAIVGDGANAYVVTKEDLAKTVADKTSKPARDEEEEAPKKTVKKAAPKKAVIEDEDEEEEAPAPKKSVKKAAVVEDDEDEEEEAPKPKAKPKAKAKPAPADEDEDEEEEAPKPKAKAKTDGKSSVGELKDDGKDQPATVDGCRIMIRRVARASGCGTEYAQAVLAEFGIDGATKVPPKKMQAFIDRCQEVIDDPETIEVEEAE